MKGFKGVIPVEYKVLVRPDIVDDQSSGGMYLPDSARDRQQYEMDKGIILSHGEGFFKDLPGPTPEIGNRIMFNKYAGSIIDIYIEEERVRCRLINDKDICAILKEE